MFATGEIEKYTKKEQVSFQKEVEKMDRYLAGLVNLEKVPDAIYIADLRVEKTALQEARRVNVPLVAVCDSNVDPTKVDYPIPGNDDAVNSIKLIADLMAEAVKEGKALYEKAKAEGKATDEKAVVHRTHDTEEKSETKSVRAKAPVKTERRALKKEVSV